MLIIGASGSGKVAWLGTARFVAGFTREFRIDGTRPQTLIHKILASNWATYLRTLNYWMDPSSNIARLVKSIQKP